MFAANCNIAKVIQSNQELAKAMEGYASRLQELRDRCLLEPLCEPLPQDELQILADQFQQMAVQLDRSSKIDLQSLSDQLEHEVVPSLKMVAQSQHERFFEPRTSSSQIS